MNLTFAHPTFSWHRPTATDGRAVWRWCPRCQATTTQSALLLRLSVDPRTLETRAIYEYHCSCGESGYAQRP